MHSNRIYIFKPLFVLTLAAALFGIYLLAKPRNLTGPALMDCDVRKQNGHLTELDLPYGLMSGTVLDVKGQIVSVLGDGSPSMISLVYVNEDLPTGLTPGKTVIMSGEFKKGLFVTDNIIITGVSPWTALETSFESLGLIDGIIFFIAYWLL